MGIFSRMRDIINANINAMLDKAEDPEKLIKLMIQEMEDTLVEVKASCAGVMAARKRVERELEAALAARDRWDDNARLAVSKERDELAREALLEKRRHQQRAESLERELAEHDGLVAQYQDDIMQLEEKLSSVREKQRVLVQRHIHARKKLRAEQDMRRVETTDAFARFDAFQTRIERMEAEAELVNVARKPALEEEFARLQGDDEVEEELEALKADVRGDAAQPSQ